MEKIVPDCIAKNQNWAYLWISTLKCYKVCFYIVRTSRGLPEHINTKMLTACF